jgi:hypothetical protein
MDDAVVRQRIRRRIADGTLPRDGLGALSATNGAGETCDACAVLVSTRQTLDKLARVDPPVLQFHSECFWIWRVERNRV